MARRSGATVSKRVPPQLASAKLDLRRIWAVFGLLALVGYFGFNISDPSDLPVAGPALSTEPNIQGLSVEFDNPLGPTGKKVPLQVANALIKKYVTAELGSTGPAGVDHVTDAWVDGTGQVAVQLDTGILFIYSPDTRTSAQYANDAAEEITLGEWEGTMIPLRGVMARAAEKSDAWSASLAWKEGQVLVEMYGDGGQILDELLAVAEEMRFGGI